MVHTYCDATPQAPRRARGISSLWLAVKQGTLRLYSKRQKGRRPTVQFRLTPYQRYGDSLPGALVADVVQECRSHFGIELPSCLIKKRQDNFLSRSNSVDNLLCRYCCKLWFFYFFLFLLPCIVYHWRWWIKLIVSLHELGEYILASHTLLCILALRMHQLSCSCCCSWWGWRCKIKVLKIIKITTYNSDVVSK